MSMEEASGKKFSRNYVQWTPDMDRAFLDVHVEYHNNCDHAQDGWKSHVYHNDIKVVHGKCGIDSQRRKSYQGAKLLTSTMRKLAKLLLIVDLVGIGKRMFYNLAAMKCATDMWRYFLVRYQLLILLGEAFLHPGVHPLDY
jgi:hypothetical protein